MRGYHKSMEYGLRRMRKLKIVKDEREVVGQDECTNMISSEGGSNPTKDDKLI